MTERELQGAIVECAQALGFLVAHFRSVPVKRGKRVVWETPVQADGAGFPDLILVRDRVVWAEIKVGRNKLSEAQERWRTALNGIAEFHVWREDDWLEGRVETILR